MSLTSFVKTPRISQAFDQCATKARTPKVFKKRPLLVEDANGPQGSAGASFDYLARFHIARVLRDSNIAVHQRQWISEYVQDRLYPNVVDDHGYDIGANERWHGYLNDAHAEARAYIDGQVTVHWLAVLVQYMAHVDLFVRTMMGANMNFDACGRVARELITMINQFQPIELFAPKERVILNPTFALSDDIGGADADLIVDNRLIEFKTTKRLSLTKGILLQLAGYAVLHDLGGTMIDDVIDRNPINSVCVYFARHNVLIEVPLPELFPDRGYKEFREIFEGELRILQERKAQYEQAFDAWMADREAGDRSRPYLSYFQDCDTKH